METNKTLIIPKGYKMGGLHSGVKKVKKDLALIESLYPAQMAAVYTTNVVKAAPVIWNKAIHQAGKGVKAIVINSGNANACTGLQGIKDNETMASKVAQMLECDSQEVLTASTGVIGLPMPIETIVKGIETLAPQLTSNLESGVDASHAIMTTDTFAKVFSIIIECDGVPVTLSGMAKGSGMIHPNMATMLSFIVTDANISGELLQKCLTHVNEETYNMISVDGDTSTNDMVIALANGASGMAPIVEGSETFDQFAKAFHLLNETLAKRIIKDGEGAGKLIEVSVNGAKTKQDAKWIAKSILNSSLVKTAFFGEDANWGRILCAAGYSGADFDPNKVSLKFKSQNGQIDLLDLGQPIAFSEEKALEVLKAEEIQIILSLLDGEHGAVGWGCDLSYEYVRINGEYRS